MLLPTRLYQITKVFFSYNLGKAPSVIVEASRYPNAPTSICSGDFQVGFT